MRGSPPLVHLPPIAPAEIALCDLVGLLRIARQIEIHAAPGGRVQALADALFAAAAAEIRTRPPAQIIEPAIWLLALLTPAQIAARADLIEELELLRAVLGGDDEGDRG